MLVRHRDRRRAFVAGIFLTLLEALSDHGIISEINTNASRSPGDRRAAEHASDLGRLRHPLRLRRELGPAVQRQRTRLSGGHESGAFPGRGAGSRQRQVLHHPRQRRWLRGSAEVEPARDRAVEDRAYHPRRHLRQGSSVAVGWRSAEPPPSAGRPGPRAPPAIRPAGCSTSNPTAESGPVPRSASTSETSCETGSGPSGSSLPASRLSAPSGSTTARGVRPGLPPRLPLPRIRDVVQTERPVAVPQPLASAQQEEPYVRVPVRH